MGLIASLYGEIGNLYGEIGNLYGINSQFVWKDRLLYGLDRDLYEDKPANVMKNSQIPSSKPANSLPFYPKSASILIEKIYLNSKN